MALFATGSLLLVAGCAAPPERNPDLPLPPAFSKTGASTTPDQWWTAFNNADLNARIDRALGSNLTLAESWSRLLAADAALRGQRSLLWPDLNAVARAERTDNRADYREQYAVGLQAEFEADLWGRVRAASDAQAFLTDATYLDYQTAAISLSAEISSTYFQLQEALNQVTLLEAQVATNQDALRSLEDRFNSGLASSADLSRQEQLLEETRGQLAAESARTGLLQNRLATLEGRSRDPALDVVQMALATLPPAPATGIPADLLQRRPDVLSALARLQAADAEVSSAARARFPRLALTASVETAAERPSALFSDWADRLAASLVTPVFTAGRLKADVERQRAEAEGQLAAYRRAILEAIEEVESALLREASQRTRLQHLERQVELATIAYQQLQAEFANGVSDYLDVLTALGQLQRLDRETLEARRILIEFRIALYRSLAGGFTTREFP